MTNLRLTKNKPAPWTGVLVPDDEFRYLVEQARIVDKMQDKVEMIALEKQKCQDSKAEPDGSTMLYSGLAGIVLGAVAVSLMHR